MSYCAYIGMYALRERRQYVGQEDFEMAVAKVSDHSAFGHRSPRILFSACLFHLSISYIIGSSCLQLHQVLKKNAEGNTSVNKLFN